MSSTYSPITYPAWTYKSLSNAYEIQFFATWTTVSFLSTATTAGNVYAFATFTFTWSGSTTHAELGFALHAVMYNSSNSQSGATATFTLLLDGVAVATKTLDSGSPAAFLGTYTSLAIGSTHTLTMEWSCVTAGQYIQNYYGTDAFYVGNIVAGSGFNDNFSGFYKIPTLSGSQVKNARLTYVMFNDTGTLYLLSANAEITYLSTQTTVGLTNAIVDIEGLVDFGDSSNPLLIGKKGTEGVVVAVDIEEGDAILQNYPFSNIEGM